MDTARIEAWLMNEKEMHDTSLRTLPPSILRRPKPTISTICPDRDWTNPNRFSDPLNRTSRLSNNSITFTLPQARASKANSWYLDNHIPWRRHDPSKSWASWDDRVQSLFATENGNKKPAVAAAPSNSDHEKILRTGHSGASKTWERTRPTRTACPLRPNVATLETGSVLTLPTAAAGRLNFHTLSQRTGFSPFSSARQSLGAHLLGAAASDKSCISNPGSQQGRSPDFSSSRSSISPQGTLHRLSPGMFHRHHPQAASRLSPTTLLQPPSRTTSPYSSTSRSTSPGFMSQCSGNSWMAISRQTSPFSSNASSSGGDMSGVGSETDDDFFYVSCHQLTQGLAGLSMAGARSRHAGLSPATACSTKHSGLGGFRVVENPTFAYPGSGNYGDEEEDFDGCSDDALSDDVFLDNPEQPINEEVTRVTARNTSEQEATITIAETPQHQELNKGDMCRSTNTSITEEHSETQKVVAEGEHQTAADSLRRNSLQSKMRRTWRQRRHIPAGDEIVTNNRLSAKADTPSAKTSSSPDLSTSKSAPSASLASPAGPEEDTSAMEQPHKDKPCYYYVISPTDDDNMPDVIAVRKSSVELIRWQNSLRRRRRRQAKRHDLGRAKTRESKMSATV